MTVHQRAGTPALPEDLIDVDEVLRAYGDIVPDPSEPGERVAFGTSGHRGTSLNGSFNEAHIRAMSAAIAQVRAEAGITGPLFLGADTHALSGPAAATARRVLLAAGVRVLTSEGDEFVPTPAISRAILDHNRYRAGEQGTADGIVITPSHNPPQDGGFKYNPPHGGPADDDVTSRIAALANELLERGSDVDESPSDAESFDFITPYVEQLPEIIDLDAIRAAGIRIGAHALGGSAYAYWRAIADRWDLDITVLGPKHDPQWSFMTLDWDGQIRMDPSSRHAMALVGDLRGDFDLIVANDADADRFGIVTPGTGLMQPNHVLALAVDHLLTTRDVAPEVGIGKTVVSSAIIDRVVAAHGRELVEVPVGFKWFVPGLADGSILFGGEESAGASFLRRDGHPWSTDKDGMLMCLLAAELLAVTGQPLDERYRNLTARHGTPHYTRIDAPATPAQKARLTALNVHAVTETTLAGDPITRVLTEAPGNGAAIGGLKVETEHAWFAARPSGTEAVMKVYAESFRGDAHLSEVVAAAEELVARALESNT